MITDYVLLTLVSHLLLQGCTIPHRHCPPRRLKVGYPRVRCRFSASRDQVLRVQQTRYGRPEDLPRHRLRTSQHPSQSTDYLMILYELRRVILDRLHLTNKQYESSASDHPSSVLMEFSNAQEINLVSQTPKATLRYPLLSQLELIPSYTIIL